MCVQNITAKVSEQKCDQVPSGVWAVDSQGLPCAPAEAHLPTSFLSNDWLTGKGYRSKGTVKFKTKGERTTSLGCESPQPVIR